MEVSSYSPPAWAENLKVPSQRYSLACLPTPIHRWALPGLPDDVELYIKRDDLTGMQLSGNKVTTATAGHRGVTFMLRLLPAETSKRQRRGAGCTSMHITYAAHST
jgi:hypothetical protein